ncbi:MAG: PepSY domain-containing protein [Methanosarcinales archaeon]|nr:PepSY domain-containing protein [Methanosarcinales archaeon]
MKKTMMVLLVIAAVIGATGITSARMGSQDGYYAQQNADSDWANNMYQWMGQHMGRFGGQMMGYGQYGAGYEFCTGEGPGYYLNENTDVVLLTQEKAVQLIEDAVDGTTSEVYQMGLWFVASYEGDDGTTKQARVNMVTGEVYVDFYAYMSENNDFNSGRGGFKGAGNGAGCAVWG